MNHPLPTGEAWRWSDLAGVEAALAASATGLTPDPAAWRVGDGPLWVFVDGRPVAQPDLGYEHERAGQPLADPATRARGVALDLGPEHAGAGTVEILHFATGGIAHLHHRYTLAADAQASVVETYVHPGDAPMWTNVAVTADLADGARLMRSVRHLEATGTATETTAVTVGRAAAYAGTTLIAGGASTRAETRATLAAPGAFASNDGAVLASASAKHDAIGWIVHAAPDTASRQTWRAVARDTATASMQARVDIARGAQRSNAAQSLRGLLLDRTATINAKPELEIFADDVKAAHGCAVGELDRAALFYLAARGVPPLRARALMTGAFLADALGAAGDARARAALTQGALGWLETA